jgi:hypothetical protein
VRHLRGSHRLVIAAAAVCATAAILSAVAWAVMGRGSEPVDYSPYGRVIDDTGTPIQGASVLTRPLGRRGPVLAIGIGSGRDGRFDDGQISEPGTYRITVSANGFRPQSKDVSVGVDGWGGGELEFVLQRE